ncbi:MULTISPECIES: ABC-ATPase domain-containing protein [unclassified Streptomyces]|uniref:ABC-ATPase domain-containing protein n=1 Tax=unclassified Streptomyces TaxID=2593676 RepID=UPI002E0FF58E|nr:ABC-ATPase domain-containing protein [Streptomyces sp. NBC_01186]WSS44453.1 ABC-ATPase domain-containing protein [Streptomyces sp. NBC_01187]
MREQSGGTAGAEGPGGGGRPYGRGGGHQRGRGGAGQRGYGGPPRDRGDRGYRGAGGGRRDHDDRRDQNGAPHDSFHPARAPRTGLAAELRSLEGAQYGRYKSLVGRWELPGGETLELVRGQADPYAPPARVAVHVPGQLAALPGELWRTPTRRRALASYLVREAARALGGEKALRVDAGGQEVLERSSCTVSGADGSVTLRLGAALPGRGRRIDGREAERLLCQVLPRAAERALRYGSLDTEDVRRFVETVEDSVALRDALDGLGLVGFVAEGAVLPRRSGVDDRPASGEGVVPFVSPAELRVTVELPHAGAVSGMGVPEGVSLVVGGGFHGKSTLLRALETGIWDHVPGDGRELVVSRAETVKLRAEDGRRVERVDVHAFVDHLPDGSDTSDFSTQNASGSTSQAASLCEAVEAGARVLLIDEDTAATNLMIRDARMQTLVAKEREPLTPLVDSIRSLHRDHGVSTVLVMGGSGDYLEVADRVVMMDAYRPSDVTVRAHEIASVPTGRHAEAESFPGVVARVPDPASLDAEVRGRPRIRARGEDVLSFGDHEVDLRAVEQIADPRQVTGIGLALELMVRRGLLDGRRTLSEALDLLDEALADGPTAALLTIRDEDFAAPRRFETAAAVNRVRGLRMLRT